VVGSLPTAGFGNCGRCPYRDSGSALRCWTCAAASIRLLEGTPRCPVCDQTLGGRAGCDNYWCEREDRGFDAVWAIARHTGTLRQVVARYKYRGYHGFARVLGRVLAGYLIDHSPWFEEVDLVAACPGLAPRDHVPAIVDEAARLAGDLWSFDGGCVIKRRATRPMMAAGSPRARRLQAASDLRASLAVPDPARVAGKRILVIDDVLTDGSTLHEVALALRGAGAAAVSGLVLARQPWIRV